MYNFNSILEKSKKDLTRNIVYSEHGAQSLYRLIKKYYEEHPDATDEEIYHYFEDLFIEINLEIARLPIMSIKNQTIEYNICRYLNRNEKQRREFFEQVLEEEKNGKKLDATRTYTSNRISSTRTLTINLLRELRDSQNYYTKEDKKQIKDFLGLPRRTQTIYKQKLDSQKRRDLQQLIDLFDKDEFTQYSSLLKKCEPSLAAELKESYIDSIMKLGNRFKQFRLLETYCKNQQKLFERVGIEELTYPLRDSNDDTISLEELFTREKLESFSLNKLAMLNTFWLNRYTKELESMNQSFFIVKKLGLLSQIKDAKSEKDTDYIRIQIEEEKLEKIYMKMNFLHRILRLIFKEVERGNYDSKIIESIENGKTHKVKKIDTRPIMLKLENELGEEYKTYFSQLNPDTQHDFFYDVEDYRIMENATHNTYKAKDMNIIAILSNLYEVDFSKNWGIIKEKSPKNSKMILLAIDMDGLNMPARFHVEKSLIIDFLKGYRGNTLFPIYEGDRDFQHEYQVLTTQILMPLCEKQRKGLKTLIQKGNRYQKNLLEHILFLANGTYPEHLKIETTTKKKGKVKISKKIPPRRYIDLSTGDEYVESKNGEIEKVENNITKSSEGR